jgi:hypothetical protein
MMNKPSPLGSAALVAIALVTTGAARPAEAAPRVGVEPTDARAVDVDDRVFSIASAKGRPLVIVYEDRDSAKVNAATKRDLGELMKDGAIKGSLVVAAVADVSEYDSWPAKGFVKDAIREQSKKTGTTIWCDWSGGFRKALELRKGTSNVLVIGRDGRVKLAVEGALTEEQRRELSAIVRREASAKS